MKHSTLLSTILASSVIAGAASAQSEPTVDVDTYFGSPTVSYPISVAPGTAGMAPTLGLTYNPSLGDSGLGQGWKISGLDCIEVSTKDGVPAYDSLDPLLLSGEEIVETGGGYFGTRIESFLRIQKHVRSFGKVYWIVSQKDGKRLRLGYEPSAAIDVSASGPERFLWSVDKVEDPFGNSFRVVYDDLGDPGVIYPQRVEYTFHLGAPVGGLRTVEFEWEGRPDPALDYSAGFRRERGHRLRAIEIRVQGSLVRRYELEYGQDLLTSRSRLLSIQEVGSNGLTAFPPAHFEYGVPDLAFGPAFNWYSVAPGGNTDLNQGRIRCKVGNETFLELMDFDGDGLVDRMRRSSANPYGVWWMRKGSGSGMGAEAYWPGVEDGGQGSGSSDWNSVHATAGNEETYVMTADFDGDGRPDRMIRPPYSPFTDWKLQRNNGTGFEPGVLWTGVATQGDTGSAWGSIEAQAINETYVGLWDMNGDGLLDRVMRGYGNNTPWSWIEWQVQLSNGAGFEPPFTWTGVDTLSQGSSWWSTPTASSNDGTYIALVDMNGDGLPDRLMQNDGYPFIDWKVQFNHGRGFEPPVPWTGVDDQGAGSPWWGIISRAGLSDVYVDLVDMNGDGLPDRLMQNQSGNYGNWWVQINNGRGFEPKRLWAGVQANYPGDPHWNEIRWGGNQLDISLQDVNGDGLPDRIYRVDPGPYDHWKVQLNLAEASRLRALTTPRGARISLEFTPSSWFDNTGTDDLPDLPYGFPVLTERTVDDGLGNLSTTRYEYEGGYWSASAREFRGFATARVVAPDGSWTRIEYLQGDALKGRQAFSAVYAPDGALLSLEENEWSAATSEPLPGNFVDLVLLQSVTRTSYDGLPTGLVARTEFGFDAYGNVTEERRMGDPQDPEDDMTIIREYAVNPSAWILHAPKLEELRDSSGTMVSRSEFYYDGSSSLDAMPIHAALTRQVEIDGSTNPATSMSYDEYGNLIASIDAMGNLTTIEYESSFKTFPEIITYPLGSTEVFTHDPGTGLVLRSIDANGLESSTTYDPLGRPIEAWGPLDSDLPGVTMEYVTDAVPHVTITCVRRVSDSADLDHLLTSYVFFDGLGRRIQLREPHGQPGEQVVHDLEYDSSGRLARRSLPYLGPEGDTWIPSPGRPSVSIQYDFLGRQSRLTEPDGAVRETEYAAPWVIRTDETGLETHLRYDAHARLVEVVESPGGAGAASTRYSYNALGELTELVNAKGDVTSMSYDLLGRRIGLVDPDVGSWTYEFDPVGNLVARTDARGHRVEYQYDGLNRLTATSYPDGTQTENTYDTYPDGIPGGPYSIGRRTQVVDASGSTVFAYDELGRVVRETKAISGAGVFTVGRAFDSIGNLVTIDYPDGKSVLYEYNRAGQAVRIHGYPLNPIYLDAVEYDAAGQITRMAYGNGVETTYGYHPLSRRLASITSAAPTGPMQDLSYEYDPHGNVVQITDGLALPGHSSLSQSFEYDGLHRLARAAGSYGELEYEYDLVGNMVRRNEDVYEIGGEGAPANGVTSGPCFRASYDANGNLVRMPGRSYSYDDENRIARARIVPENCKTISGSAPWPPAIGPSALELEFVYDGDGGRVMRRGSDGSETIYVGGVYEERNGRRLKHVFLGLKRIVIDESPTPAEPNPSDLYFHPDHLGSTSLVTDEVGSEVDHATYLPFGGEAEDEGEHASPYLFTGKELDGDTDLYFMESRFYIPELGRFTAPDQAGRDLSDPQSLNRYAYSRNNPLRYSDPSGDFFMELLLGYFLYEHNDTFRQFVDQTERHFLRPLTKNPSGYARDHRAELKDAAIAAGVAVLGALIPVTGGGSAAALSWAMAGTAVSAATSSLVLSTPGGQEAVHKLASGLQSVGVSPRVSYVLAGAVSGLALNVAIEGVLSGVSPLSSDGVQWVEEASLKDLGKKAASVDRAGIELNFLKEVRLDEILETGARFAGVSSEHVSLAQAIIGWMPGSVKDLLSKSFGSVYANLRVSWAGAAAAAAYGSMGYRLGREVSEAFRSDRPLLEQLLDQISD